MSIKQAVKELRRINVSKIALLAIGERESEVLDLNTEDQLFEKGIDANGNSLGEYQPFTIDIKEAKGQPTDRITLKDSGSFTDKFFLNNRRWPVEIDSKDPKRDEIVEQFGSNVFGLTEQNTKKITDEQLREEVVFEVQDAITKALALIR